MGCGRFSTMSETNPAPVPEAPKADPKPSSDDFAQRLQGWMKGEGKPKHPLSQPLIDDIKAHVAERDALIQKMQEAEKEFRQSQTQHAHLSGRIDGLVASVHRLETHAAG